MLSLEKAGQPLEVGSNQNVSLSFSPSLPPSLRKHLRNASLIVQSPSLITVLLGCSSVNQTSKRHARTHCNAS